MALRVAELAVEQGPDLVDRVGELVAAVLDVDDRLALRDEAAVDVSDTAHQLSSSSSARAPERPSDFSFRCRAERSMPMKAAVREMLPEKRSICALRYSRSNTSRASRSGSAIIRSAPRLVAWSVTMASAGSMLAVIGSDGAPEARISILSTLLRSWRRFPGHARTCNVARASSANRRFGMPVASLIRSLKYS